MAPALVEIRDANGVTKESFVLREEDGTQQFSTLGGEVFIWSKDGDPYGKTHIERAQAGTTFRDVLAPDERKPVVYLEDGQEISHEREGGEELVIKGVT